MGHNLHTPVLAWATDPILRHRASSGGFTKAMLSFLVREKIVEAAVITRMRTPFEAEALVATDDHDILSENTNSVYHMANVAAAVPRDRPCAVTSLPCQARQLRSRDSVKVLIVLMCNQVPGPGWRAHIESKLGAAPGELSRLRYRGEGWPGTAEGTRLDGVTLQFPWMPLWHNTRYLTDKCRSCPRVEADCEFLVGDPWNILDAANTTLVFPKSALGDELVQRAVDARAIELRPAPREAAERCLESLRMQKRQRRRGVAT